MDETRIEKVRDWLEESLGDFSMAHKEQCVRKALDLLPCSADWATRAAKEILRTVQSHNDHEVMVSDDTIAQIIREEARGDVAADMVDLSEVKRIAIAEERARILRAFEQARPWTMKFARKIVTGGDGG